MANNRSVYQQTFNVSIPKAELQNIASNMELSKKDYKVLLVLLTELEGFAANSNRSNDPLNFKKIDVSAIADILALSKKEVKKSIEVLLEECIIETGSSDAVKNGYRFTF